MTAQAEGILLVNKQPGKTAFSLVAMLRRRLGVKTIGHAGTLDPFATGVMVMLIGKNFTRQSNSFLNESKEYTARVHLGIETDSYDCDGIITAENPYIPTLEQVKAVLQHFQHAGRDGGVVQPAVIGQPPAAKQHSAKRRPQLRGHPALGTNHGFVVRKRSARFLLPRGQPHEQQRVLGHRNLLGNGPGVRLFNALVLQFKAPPLRSGVRRVRRWLRVGHACPPHTAASP